jgi:plasmid maintenance system antidote protein VapI
MRCVTAGCIASALPDYDTCFVHTRAPPKIPAESYHVWDFVEEELAARKWDLDMLAYYMGTPRGAQFDVWRLTLDLCKHARDEQRTDVTFEGSTGEALGKAFGVSPRLFVNLDAQWKASREDA